MTLFYDDSTVGGAATDQPPAGRSRSGLGDRLGEAFEAVRSAHERGELGFLECPDIDADAIASWAAQKQAQDLTDQVVIGIGGSSLGARAVCESMPHRVAGGQDGRPAGGLRTHFAENIDPVGAAGLFESLDFADTVFVVVTKSGSTIETMGKFWCAWDRAVDALGADEASDHFVAITGPENDGLRALVDRYGFEHFPVPPNVGGRFSVLSAVGLVPLALAGYDVAALLEGGRRARRTALDEPAPDNVLVGAAGDIYELYERGVDHIVMMSYSDQLLAMADWFRQLWAESLGKAQDRHGDTVHVGMTPIKARGAIDQHSQVQLYIEGPNDKHFVFLEVESFARDLQIPARDGLPDSLSHLAGKKLSQVFGAELDGTRRALQEADRPCTTWRFDRVGPSNLGEFIVSWEFITAVVAELLDVDAFNQPGVELGKKVAHGLLGRRGFETWAEMARSNQGRDRGEPIA